jgi:hypothetical protein
VAVFLTAGAASALPGSPVRQWVSEVWSGSSAATSAPEPGTSATEELSAVQDPQGPAAGVRALDGAIDIRIHDLPDQAELRVRWIEGEEAWIRAGEGTRFTTGQGRIEAFAPPGTVEVEIPRDLQEIRLILNGAILLQKRGGELEILEPTHRRTPSEIRFGAPVGTNEGEI